MLDKVSDDIDVLLSQYTVLEPVIQKHKDQSSSDSNRIVHNDHKALNLSKEQKLQVRVAISD